MLQTISRDSLPNRRTAAPESDLPDGVAELVGVRLRRSRRMLLCHARGHSLQPGDYAVVETASGLELAKVTMANTQGSADSRTQNRSVMRPAMRSDLESMRSYVGREVDVRRDFFGAAAAEGVFVSAVRAEYRFDGSALRIRYRSDARLSDSRLRELLQSKYGTSISFRNLGPPKKLGTETGCGGGSCGSCPSNGLRERAGSEMPRPGLASAGAFGPARSSPTGGIQPIMRGG